MRSEVDGKKEVQRQFDNSINELGQWKTRYETDAVNKTAILEYDKKKLNSRVGESEQAYKNANYRCDNLEKVKSKLQQEIKDISVELDRGLARVSMIEKKQRGFDKTLAEEEDKNEVVSLKLKEMLDERKAEVHNVFKARQRLEELEEEYEASTKESRILVEEVADLRDQINESNKSTQDISKAKTYLEKERNELQKTLYSKEDMLEKVQATTIQSQLNYQKCKLDMMNILQKKDEDVDLIRKNTHLTINNIQARVKNPPGKSFGKPCIRSSRKDFRMTFLMDFRMDSRMDIRMDF